VLYTLTILGIGQIIVPYTANGSLLHDDHGAVIGSEMLAQPFAQPGYFRPRPSAAEYNASATGGSNLSPTNPKLRFRAETIISKSAANGGKKIPVDLVTASGSGMDPHITIASAKYQAVRVAEARGMPYSSVVALLDRYTERAGGFLTAEPLVNVLLVNRDLDRLEQ
jgi:K+-transporting ATPase ATPase C chain